MYTTCQSAADLEKALSGGKDAWQCRHSGSSGDLRGEDMRMRAVPPARRPLQPVSDQSFNGRCYIVLITIIFHLFCEHTSIAWWISHLCYACASVILMFVLFSFCGICSRKCRLTLGMFCLCRINYIQDDLLKKSTEYVRLCKIRLCSYSGMFSRILEQILMVVLLMGLFNVGQVLLQRW